jgi:muramoyltetrapeptide carboxypeptidase
MLRCKGTVLLALAMGLLGCTKEYTTKEYNTYNTYNNTYDSEYYSTVLASQTEITTDIRPPYLQKGDTVAVCAASNYVTSSDLASGIAQLKSWGLAVKLADNLYATDGRYAGTVAQRVEGLQKMIDDPNVKAIIMARGGYGCAQIMNYLDLKGLASNPKWIVGYSDVTALHIALNNRGIESIHGPMVKTLTQDANSADALKNALFGNLESTSITTNSHCVEGTAEGRLVGGNLSLIYSMGGTLFDLNVKGGILFFEDTGEANYAIDRMLMNLKLSGKLDAVKGIVVGEFTNMTASGDSSIESIVRDRVADLKIPVMYGVQVGHDTENLSLYLGRKVKLTVDDSKSTLTYE